MTLIDLVDALTLSRTENVRQAEDDGTYIKTVPVTHAPLLQRFRDAARPSGNTTTGAGAAAHTRNLINSAAVFEYAKMNAAIDSWCRTAEIQPAKLAEDSLRAWYVVYSQYNHDPAFYEGQLKSFINTIESHLDPPKQIEITVSCPVCGKREWWDEDGNLGAFPLLLRYRIDEHGSIRNPEVICRACDPITEWRGLEAISELGEEVTERIAG